MLNSLIRYLLYRKDDKPIIKYDALAVITIIVLVIGIYLTNIHGNFFISGWDNLHPEFNFKLNLQRAWDSAWQEYQGLGVPAGHGHAAELPRILFLIPFSWIVP